MTCSFMKNTIMQSLLLLLTGCIIFTCGCIQHPEKTSSYEPNVPVFESLTREISELTVCSFNIQFSGNFKKKDNETLAKILKDYDIIVVQEIVAPPVSGTYPDGVSYNADPESAQFLQQMENEGFSYLLSEEDTGTGDSIHLASTATEWWIAFYKPESVYNALDLPQGFLSEDRSNNDLYERVPYAFAFRTVDHHLDFVLISVHLQPGDSGPDQVRRKVELDAISDWIGRKNQTEKDFIILGDMNIKNREELLNCTPVNMISLNDECYPTNTSPNSPKPYDHVMYYPDYTSEVNTDWDIVVVDLVEAVRPYWNSAVGPFPGDPYVHDQFRQYYSDHHPVVFKMDIPEEDDD